MSELRPIQSTPPETLTSTTQSTSAPSDSPSNVSVFENSTCKLLNVDTDDKLALAALQHEAEVSETSEINNDIYDNNEDEVQQINNNLGLFNDDGSFNINNIEALYTSGDLSFEDFADICGADIEENKKGQKYFTTEDGATVTLYCYYMNHSDEEGYVTVNDENGLTIKDSSGTKCILSPEGKAIAQAQIEEYKKEIEEERNAGLEQAKKMNLLNEDGSVNINNLVESFKSGEDAYSMLKFCGVKIDIPYRNGGYIATLNDGTEIRGNHFSSDIIIICQTNGEEYEIDRQQQ